MHITEGDFERACGNVVALVKEHSGEDVCGIHGQLRALV